MTEDMKNAISQGLAQFDSIVEMVDELRKAEAAGDDSAREDAEQRIHEDALSVEVRSGWHAVGDDDGAKPDEFRILLCTGGPAAHIIGGLNEHGEPDEENIRIQVQDWFQPWTDIPNSALEERVPAASEDEEDEDDNRSARAYLAAYARCFYYGE